jgi:hypothetical protein
MSATVSRAMAADYVQDGRPDKPQVWGIISDLDLVRAGAHNDADRPARTIAHTPVDLRKAERR